MATDQPHTIVRTETRPAPAAGYLDGNYAICSCGYAMGTSLSMPFAVKLGQEHATYMNKVGN
jgi:hypothetical protein